MGFLGHSGDGLPPAYSRYMDREIDRIRSDREAAKVRAADKLKADAEAERARVAELHRFVDEYPARRGAEQLQQQMQESLRNYFANNPITAPAAQPQPAAAPPREQWQHLSANDKIALGLKLEGDARRAGT